MNTQRALPPLMLVDDDQNDALIFTRRLKEGKVPNPVIHFRNGGDAFMYLKRFCAADAPADERPCLVFLDVNMPNLSGFDVLAWARQQPGLRGMGIIMLSGATEPWDAQIAAKLGADDYLRKFPAADDLAELVATHLTASHVRRADSAPATTAAPPTKVAD